MAVAAVSGTSGMLGSAVVRTLTGAGYTVDALPRYETRIRAGTALVVHCAAKTDVRACERDYDGTVRANAIWPGELAAAAAAIRFIHISTVAVYDASLSKPHVETERYVPLGAYAASKLEGEQAVLSAHPDATAIRPMIFGRAANGSRPTLADNILATLYAGRRMRLWDNQWFDSIYIEDLADIVALLATVDVPGPLNVGAVSGVPLSQFGFGCALAREFDLDADGLVCGELRHQQNLRVDLSRLSKFVEAPAVGETLRRFRKAERARSRALRKNL